MRFVMFSLVFLMLRIVFFVFSIIFGKTSLLFLLSVLSIIRCELCSVLIHCDVPYCVMRTAILLFVFRIVFFQIRVFREIGRYGLVRVINCDLSRENVRKRLSVFERNSVTCKPFGSRSKKICIRSRGSFVSFPDKFELRSLGRRYRLVLRYSRLSETSCFVRVSFLVVL